MATPEHDETARRHRSAADKPHAQAGRQRMAAPADASPARAIGRVGLPALPAIKPGPVMEQAPARSRPVLVGTPTTALGAPKHAPAKAGGMAWELPARPGDRLMLMPGQMHFGGNAALLRTLLGSCVAVTLWHPQRRIGGMCHFLLPSRPRQPGQALDGKYGDEALDVMVARLRAARTEPHEYEAHLYGGADTMPEGSGVKFNVGERNIEQGWTLIDKHGFALQGVDVGEDVPRTVTLNIATGEVAMKRGHGRASAVPLLHPHSLPGTPPAPPRKTPTRRT